MLSGHVKGKDTQVWAGVVSSAGTPRAARRCALRSSPAVLPRVSAALLLPLKGPDRRVSLHLFAKLRIAPFDVAPGHADVATAVPPIGEMSDYDPVVRYFGHVLCSRS